MSYYMIDKSRENDPYALEDVEIFYVIASEFITAHEDSWQHEVLAENDGDADSLAGYWYQYGLAGYMSDSEPSGPFKNEESALAAARESAGFCPHGVQDDGGEICEECPAPMLWVLETPGGEYLTFEGWDRSAIKTSGIDKCAAWCDEASAFKFRAEFSLEGFAIRRMTDSEARRWGR